ncbi:hypothetical protein KJ966_17445 [bacterium]|nr:hypothetical protein [bacterium]
MLCKIETFCDDFNLKTFYGIVLNYINTETDLLITQDLVAIAPFIRQFQTKFVNYYKLSEIAPLSDHKFSNWLDEFYSQLYQQIANNGLNKSVIWLLERKINQVDRLFPDHPTPVFFQGLMRSLAVLIELTKSIGSIDHLTYQRLFQHAKKILSPKLDENFEQLGKEFLDKLIDFNARTDGVESGKFQELNGLIKEINTQINVRLMSNNTFVSITQQISEINKALKTVRKSDFEVIFKNNMELFELFWEGLTEHGYSGGENYLYGDFSQTKASLVPWINELTLEKSEAILGVLENTFYSKGLDTIEKADVPEAIHLYAINLIGEIGLKDKQSIMLVLGYHSNFVDRMIREGAYLALRKNAESVQDYFLTTLGQTKDYEQKLLIADKHDTIFEHIHTSVLVKAFGPQFKESLEHLESITAPDGILLSNFIRSAYLRLPAPHSVELKDSDDSLLLKHFQDTNIKLEQFKGFVEQYSFNGFINLIRIWGMNYVVSWALTDYEQERRLFSFIIKAAESNPQLNYTAGNKVIPLQDIVTLLSHEPDAKGLIQKLMTFLLNSKISFDYRLFSSLFQVVAQRRQQLQNGINIRDGFSEQRGYSQSATSINGATGEIVLQDPHIFHPIVIFLITVLHMKFINIPKDAFVESDISLYLNSLAEHQRNPELGYQMYLAHQLISSIPYIKDFSSHHETVIRKTIADLDESYKRKNVLIHYHRIKIHRAPSKLDLDFCLEILEGLSTRELSKVQNNLTRLMKGIGDEAIPDLENYFEHYREKLARLSQNLKRFKDLYPDTPWQDIAKDNNFSKIVRDLPGIDSESTKDIIALVKLAYALSNYWTQKINESFLDSLFSEEDKTRFKEADLMEQLRFVQNKRKSYHKILSRFDPFLEPYQHIFLKRHVIQGDWNFDFFGFWPFYKETKFELYNSDRKLAALERDLLEQWISELTKIEPPVDCINKDLLLILQQKIECLKEIMIHLKNDGLAPSKYFLDTIKVLAHDQLTVSQLHDILGILSYRELSHVDSFVANTFGHFPSRIVQALGRENLDFGLDILSVPDEELFYPLVQETVLGNIIAEAHPIHLLERFLNHLLKITVKLKKLAPSYPIFPDRSANSNRLSPVFYGYKSYALQTLAKDGFNVPALETIPVNYFQEKLKRIDEHSFAELKTEILNRILILESKTKKIFNLSLDNLPPQQITLINQKRSAYDFDISCAPTLLVSARSGSYRSMPGILGTVLNIGYHDVTDSDHKPIDLRLELNTYRVFLSTFGNVVFGINEVEFSRIVENIKKEISLLLHKKVRWVDLNNDQIANIVKQFKVLIESRYQQQAGDFNPFLNWNDPLEMLAISTLGVWKSWDSPAARQLRNFLDISKDWYTPVTLMEMKQADKNQQSFSAILFSGDPQGKTNTPHGDLLFGRPGEDIAAGLASEGLPLETVETENPKLYQQITNLLEEIKINKGYVDVDVEMVGEYDPESEKMELFVVQERQMPIGIRGESEDYRLTPTDIAPIATGKGVNGGVQYGVFLDGAHKGYNDLKETVAKVREQLGDKDEFHGPGIFLLMEYVTPEEALKMNIEGVDGVITTKIGKSSHASISAKRDGKLFICEASISFQEKSWIIENMPISPGDSKNPDIFTIVGNPKSVSPYSGNIYRGIQPLTKVVKKR